MYRADICFRTSDDDAKQQLRALTASKQTHMAFSQFQYVNKIKKNVKLNFFEQIGPKRSITPSIGYKMDCKQRHKPILPRLILASSSRSYEHFGNVLPQIHLILKYDKFTTDMECISHDIQRSQCENRFIFAQAKDYMNIWLLLFQVLPRHTTGTCIYHFHIEL